MKNMYGLDFPSLSHRFIYSYAIPKLNFTDPNCGVDEQSQQQFKAFLRGMLEVLYSDPTIIDMPFFEDTYSWKEDSKIFNPKKLKIENKFWRFVDFLIKLGETSELDEGALIIGKKAVRIKPRLEQLDAVGFEVEDVGENYRITNSDFPQMFAAFKYQASRKFKSPQHARRSFVLGIMDERTFTAKECYGEFLPDTGFAEKVEEYCRQNGFVCIGDEWLECRIQWEKEFQKKKRILFMVFSEPWKQYQVKYTVRVSDFGAVFAEFAGMSDGLKQMILDEAYPCGGCKYCVQTDKTGKKPIAVSKVSHNGVNKAICSYYPLYEMHELSTDRAEYLIELMTIADKVLGEKYGYKKST